MITSSTASRIASVIARKSSISYEGTPSGVRAWMWIIDPPSSTTRFASAAYSSGVYGIAGHWSRLATAPLIELVITTGSLKLIRSLPRSWRPAHRTEVVALRGELAPRGRHLLDRQRIERAAVRAEQLARLGLVAGSHRGAHFLAVGREAPQARHEQVLRMAHLGGRVEALARGGERAGAVETLLDPVCLLLERRVLRQRDRGGLVRCGDGCLEARLVLGLRRGRRLLALVLGAAGEQQPGGAEDEQRLQTGITSM